MLRKLQTANPRKQWNQHLPKEHRILYNSEEKPFLYMDS